MNDENQENIEISMEQLKRFQEAIQNALLLMGDINVYGYSNDKIRKDTQKKLVKSYDILFELNRYINFIRGTNDE